LFEKEHLFLETPQKNQHVIPQNFQPGDHIDE